MNGFGNPSRYRRLVTARAAVFLVAAAIALGGLIAAEQNGKDQAPNARPQTPQEKEEAQLRALLGSDGIGLGRDVGPDEEAIKPIKDKLDKEIRVQFLDTPLDRVIEFLQRESGITMLINRSATRGDEKNPVKLESESMSIKEALDWAAVATDTDWDVIKGVVIVSTPTAIKKRKLEVRVYDIRAFLVQVPNFYGGEDLDINQALSNTSSGGSSSGAQSATTLFADEESSTMQITREETIEQITTLIQDTVGQQQEWAAYGGDISNLRELNGNLIVRTTTRNHQAIAALLKQLAEAAALMVHVEARFYQVNSQALDEMVAGNKGSYIFNEEDADALLKALAQPNVTLKFFGAARVTGFNGQRLFLTASNENSFLSDLEPVTGTAGVDPTLSVSQHGARLDIETVIGFDRKSLTMTFRGDVVTGASLGFTDIPTGSPAKPGEIKGEGTIEGNAAAGTKAKDDDTPQPQRITGKVNIGGEVLPPKPPIAGAARLEKPSQDIIRYRTAVSIPNGGAVMLTGVSSMLQSVDADKGEVVLILRARPQLPQ